MEESKSPPGEPERIVCSCPEGRLGFALTRNSPGGEDVAHPDRVVIQGVTLENAITSRLRLGDVLAKGGAAALKEVGLEGNPAGEATVHPAGLLHGVARVREGERYTLICFFERQCDELL